MKVFLHHIYEYKKGLRSLVLYTGPREEESSIREKLTGNDIAFYITRLDSGRINVFFGYPSCVETIRSFGEKKLNRYTPEEDFILGVLLGYDQIKQCDRYLKKTDRIQNVPESPVIKEIRLAG